MGDTLSLRSEALDTPAFIGRLLKAAEHNEVPPTQSDIARSLEMHRQTVNKWFVAGVPPSGETILHIARKWDVNPAWLETGEGPMLLEPTAGSLAPEERELLRNYRAASPKVRSVVRSMVRVARKSVVTIAVAIPPLMAPSPSEAAIQHNVIFASVVNCLHIVRRWLRSLVKNGKVVAA